jgi:hypothetical protein
VTPAKVLLVISWIIAGAGAAVMLRSADPSTVIGVLLLIWANNVYEASQRT